MDALATLVSSRALAALRLGADVQGHDRLAVADVQRLADQGGDGPGACAEFRHLGVDPEELRSGGGQAEDSVFVEQN